MDEDDEIEDTTTLERISREDDSPDELLQGKRIRLDDREEISIGGSKQNSRGSSPASAKRQSTASSPSERRSRSSSRHDSPAEVIYELSPDQHTLSPSEYGGLSAVLSARDPYSCKLIETSAVLRCKVTIACTLLHCHCR